MEKPARKRPAIITAREYRLFVEAAAALCAATVAIRLPFRWLACWLSRSSMATSGHSGEVAEIVEAVERASRKIPWRTVCFHQGLATHWMLRARRIPSQLHYGIRAGEDRLAAHVWVSVDDAIVIGGEEAAQHACVATFPAIAR